MSLRLLYLIIDPGIRLAGAARSHRGVQERGALVLRHEVAVLRRPLPAPAGLGRPRSPGGADPAAARRAAGSSAGHARAPLLRWHRRLVTTQVDIPETARTAADQRRDHRAGRAAGRENPAGDTGGSTASCSSSATGSARRRSGGSSRRAGSRRPRAARRYDLADSSCVPRPTAILACDFFHVDCASSSDACTCCSSWRSTSRLRAHPRGDRPPGRPLDRAADPQPAHGPR